MLVAASSGVPDLFSRSGIELIKLPSLKPAEAPDTSPYEPRHLTHMTEHDVMELRAALLSAIFERYHPDLVLIDHHITGVSNELVPALVRKCLGQDNFTCAYISRDIIADPLLIRPPYERPQRKIRTIDLADAFNGFYVLDDRPDKSQEDRQYSWLSDRAESIRYLGKIAIKPRRELSSAEAVRRRLGLPDRPMVLASLGHGPELLLLVQALVDAFQQMHMEETHLLVVALSPYLSEGEIEKIRSTLTGQSVMILEYIPDLIDVINCADVVICRAGYNTVTELLLTGRPAVVIPEDTGTGEQRLRALQLPPDGFVTLTVADALSGALMESIRAIQHASRVPIDIDKYEVAAGMLEHLSCS
jgi:predicted glycosyltransferase